MYRRKQAAKEEHARQLIELAAVTGGGRNAAGDDRDAGVVRVLPEGDADGDGELPAYSRVAKPGEVPPRYGEVVVEVDGVIGGDTNGNGTVNGSANGNGVVGGWGSREREGRRRERWAFLGGRQRNDGVGTMIAPEVMRL